MSRGPVCAPRPRAGRTSCRWAAGPLGRWAAGPLGRWAAGPLGRWAAGPLGRWAAGPLGRWAAGPLGNYTPQMRGPVSMETGEGHRRGSRSFPRSACAYPPESGGVGGTSHNGRFELSKVIVRMVCATSRISCGFRGRPEPHTPPVHAGTPHGSERAGAAAATPAQVRVHRPHRSFSATAGEFGTLPSAVIPGWQAGPRGNPVRAMAASSGGEGFRPRLISARRFP